MFRLPPLPYAYDALAPTISEATLRTHHGKHHARYVEVTNSLLPPLSGAGVSLESVIRSAAKRGERKLFDNASQAWNHAFFWSCMTPAPAPTGPSGELLAAVETTFGDLAALRARFLAEGAGHFGSGWVWLVGEGGRLSVVSTHDADSPLLGSAVPLLVCDVWEHAYYLDHRNDRLGFLESWWDRLVDWSFAAAQFEAAARGRPGWRYEDAENRAAAEA